MQLNLQTNDPGFYAELKLNSPENVNVKLVPFSMKRDISSADIIVNVIISFSTGIPCSLLASWIYDVMKKKGTKKVTINSKEIRIENPDGGVLSYIEKTIEEEIS